jgi:DNA-binding NtrC family response regulator
MSKKKILVGDDDRAVRLALREFLISLNYEVAEANTCRAVKEAFQSASPDVAVLDHRFPDGTALELLPLLREHYPSVPVILLTGNGTIPLAVQAIQEGAEQFLTKPIDLAAIQVVLERVLQDKRNRQKQIAGERREKGRSVEPFLGSSSAIKQLEDQAQKVAGSYLPVLIAGETGSGKGVLAKWIHDHSERADEAFVDLNCAGFGRELLETELFGHEAGAFTGAVQRKLGLLEVGQRGTVFLDEIGDMDLQIQPKLLKALEEKKFRRLGDVVERQVDIRLISASHQNLNLLVKQKKFRSDLYFRVSTVVLTVPPLRDRLEDIPVLAQHFFERVAVDLGRTELSMAEKTAEALRQYSWPGNIRELKNVIERAVLLASGKTILPKDLQLETEDEPVVNNNDEIDSSLTIREVQKLHIERALTAEGGNVGRAASRLGITRSSLYNKINTYGLKRFSYQSE